MHNLRVGTLQWTMGVYFILNGALMLVVPYPYEPIAFTILDIHLRLEGTIFLLVGAALIGTTLTRPAHVLSTLVHLAASGILMLLARAFAVTGITSVVISFAMLAIGIALVPLLQHIQQRHPPAGNSDLFALLMGLSAALSGLTILVLPQYIRPTVFDSIQSWLPWYGAAFLGSGLALAAVQLRSRAPAWAFSTAHISFTVVFYAMLTTRSHHSWIATALYGGFGAVIVLLPWLGPRLRRVDPAALHMRMALVLAVTAALPLISAVALISRQDARYSSAQALDMQQTLAAILSQDVSSYLELHRNATDSLATHPGLEVASPEQHRLLLHSLNQSYNDVYAFATYDANGHAVARSDNRSPVASVSSYEFFTQARDTGSMVMDALLLPATGEPGIVFSTPITDINGQFSGVVVGSLKASHLTDHLLTVKTNTDDRVYLVDETGQIIAHTGELPDKSFLSTFKTPPVVALLTNNDAPGALSYGAGNDEQLAGYASIPDAHWGIIVERPAVTALAHSMQSRNMAFLILLLAIAAALSFGIVAAGELTSTLAALVRAVNQLESGHTEAPLPQSHISEVARLSAAFAALRDRLAIRTSERDLAEAALRASEERYRTIVETAQEGIWLFDISGTTTFVNSAMAKMLGYNVDEMIGTTLSTFTCSYHWPMVATSDEEHSQDTGQQEISFRRKDGSTVWAILLANPLPDPRGQPVGTLATVIDITQRKMTEQALRESEARFRTMADSAPVLIWVSEPDGSRVFFNQQWLNFTGSSLDEQLGSGWMSSMHPDDIRCCEDIYQTAVAKQQPFQMEYRLRRADGQYRWLIESGIPRLTSEHLLIGYIGSCVDITERKRAEDVLRFLLGASTALSASLDYTTTLSSVTRLVVPLLADWCTIDILSDDETIEQVAVAHVDPSREALIHELRQRYPPDPGLPHVIWHVLQTGQSTIEVDLTDDILVARTSNNEHFQLRRALGETGYITVPLRARGRILGVISLVVGDSGRRYTLDDLALAEELSYRAALAVDNARLYHEAQASIQAREQFLSIASHELKTPLTALVGYVKLLRQRQPIPQEQTDRNMRALRVISEQADRLNKLITLMLDLSRIQQGQLTIDPAPLDLTALARRVAGDIEWTLDQHTLMVETPSEPVYMIGDAVRLEQALHNLLQNAVKYSPAGGLVQVGVAQHATFACMWVTDQGIGIPAKSRSLLFQRFQRINNPETQHVSGLGLGLYIVKEIVALHNGSIDVTSKEGMGSTFTIRLPLNVLDHAAYAAAEQQQTPYSR